MRRKLRYSKFKKWVLTFRDTFCFQLPCFSCVTNIATIILVGKTNTVRYLSLYYLFCDFYEGLDGKGGGGANVSCHLKFRAFISSQLDFRPFVSCQLNDC